MRVANGYSDPPKTGGGDCRYEGCVILACSEVQLWKVNLDGSKEFTDPVI